MLKKTKKLVQFSLKLAVMVGFVTWLVVRTDWHEVGWYFSKISPAWMTVYFLFLIGGMLISARKWQQLLAFKGVRVSVTECFKLYFVGAFINNFLPSTIGGDTYRSFQIGKRHDKHGEVAASVVADRFSGLVGIMLLAPMFGLLNWSKTIAEPMLLGCYSLSLVGAAVLLFFFQREKLPLAKLILPRVPEMLKKFFQGLKAYADPQIFKAALGYSVLFALVGVGLVNWVLFLGLGVQVNWLDYLAVIFFTSIVSALPISINNIGTKEWAYVFFFGFFGVPAAAVVSVAILSRLAQLVFSLGALPIYLKLKD